MRSRRNFLRTSALAAGATSQLISTARADHHEESPSSKPLGVALVGLGKLSTGQLAPAFQDAKHVKLAGIVTGTPENEEKWAEKYGIPKTHMYNYETFEKIEDNPDIDIVYIVLPNSMHAEFTIRAAKIGKHVLCEKPMANSAKDCQRMIDACNAAGVKLAIGYRCQFEPNHLESIRLAREEAFGKIKLLNAGFGFKAGDPSKNSHIKWRLNKEMAGGGALMDVGVYALQACRYLTGQEPTEILAMETKTDPVKFAEVDETINWSMRFPSGAIANCSTTYNANGMNHFKALAERGWIGLDPAYGYSRIKGGSSKGAFSFEPINQFAAEMDDFALCIKQNRKSKVSGEEGLKDLLAVEAIYASIATGKTATVATSA